MSRSAIRYSKAILDLANQNNNLAAVSADIASIEIALAESQELNFFLKSPVVKLKKKLSALKAIFSEAQPETLSLFDLLVTNKRFDILGKITTEYQSLLNTQNGVVKALVITATPLDNSLEKLVLAKAKTLTPFQVILENKIDPSIIGGFILRVGDQQLNASVANKLQNLKRELV